MKFIGQDYDNSASSQMNIITDGQLTCCYRDIPPLFEEIKKYFLARDISTDDCLALECDNSVPSALVLLYLFEEGYNFLLLSEESKASHTLDSKYSLPTFCQYKIGTKHVDNSGKIANLNPDNFLHVVKNVQSFNQHKINKVSPKLYLRTSGSTEIPKMAMHSHTKLQGNTYNCIQRFCLNSNDRVAIPVPIFHSYGLTAALLPSVAVRASIDLQRSANILRYLQREKEFNPNVVFMTPTFCETLLKGRKSPRTYRLTVTAGDRIRGNIFAQYESMFGCLVQLYGSTETGAIAAASPDDPSEIRAQTVGKPMQNVQMRLQKGLETSIDANQDIGEFWCYHKYAFDGYVNENGESVNLGQEYQDGWLRTKDFGRIGLDGSIEVLGRCDHSVNRDGLLVFFAEVEKAIEHIETIESAVVVSKGESQRGKKLIAYCVLVKGNQTTDVDIRTACFEVLPQRAIPDTIVIVDSLPQLPNGKVDRQKLISMVDKI